VTIAEDCLQALAALETPSTAREIHRWLVRNVSYFMRIEQVRGALGGLVRRKPPLVELAGRIPAGRGRPGQWQLTGPGRAWLGLPGGRVPCGLGWPP